MEFDFDSGPLISESAIKKVSKALRKGNLSDSYCRRHVPEFEECFANFVGARYAVAVTSGTTSLFLSLKSIGIGPGDEVLVPAYTFVATAGAVKQCGATPIVVDVNPTDLNMDLKDAEEKITKKTKAIIPVHLHGVPLDLDSLDGFIRRYNIHCIEDCAQAIGSYYQGRHVGSVGIAGCFSFQESKNIATGEGGMIVTPSLDIATHLRLLRNHGKTEWENQTIWGYNFRMTNIQAIIGMDQLQHIDELNDLRRHQARIYQSILCETPVQFLQFQKYMTPSYSKFPLFTKERDSLHAFLINQGIPSQHGYSQVLCDLLDIPHQEVPIARKVIPTILNLPIGPRISPDSVEYAATLVKKFFT